MSDLQYVAEKTSFYETLFSGNVLLQRAILCIHSLRFARGGAGGGGGGGAAAAAASAAGSGGGGEGGEERRRKGGGVTGGGGQEEAREVHDRNRVKFALARGTRKLKRV